MTNTVAKKWNEAAEIPEYRARFLANLDFARKLQHDLYLDGRSPFTVLQAALDRSPAPRTLELAGGRGDFALAMLDGGIAETVHMVDVSDGALTKARQKAQDRGIDGLTLELADVNRYQINAPYDLVVFSQALHHIEGLEHILAQAAQSLRPTGLLYVNDYVGPSRMQWTDQQLTVMNDLLSLLPEGLRTELAVDGTPSTRVKNIVRRVPIETYLEVDPSEGVRSGEIDTVLRSTFTDVVKHPLGGTLSYELFRLIAHNFDDSDEARSLVKLVVYFEHQLIQAGVLDSDFAVYLCRP